MFFIISFLITFSGITTTAEAGLLRKINPNLLVQKKKTAPKVLGERLVYVAKSGNDRNDGLSKSKALKSIQRAQEIINQEEASLFIIRLGEGAYNINGEWEILKPVKIVGRGMNQSILNLSLKQSGTDLEKWDAGIRIATKNVTIRNLTIKPNVTVKEASFGTGGRGEYGTGITIGHYLENKPLKEVSNISIANVKIERTQGYTAPGISILGRSHDISINNVEINGTNSTAIIMHWGGYNNIGRSPIAINDRSYKLYRTFHPHDISITNLKIDNARRAFIISSSYNVKIDNVTGRTSALLTAVPGDEVNRYSIDSEKEKINSNISISNVDIAVFNYALNKFISLTSQGTSKVISGLKKTLGFRNFKMRNIKVNDYQYSSNRTEFVSGIRLLRAEGLRSSLVFENINLGKLINPDSNGRIIRVVESKSAVFKNIKGYTSAPIMNVDNESIIFEDLNINTH